MIQEVVIDFVFSTKIIILIIKQVAYIITAMSAATVWLYMFALNHTFLGKNLYIILNLLDVLVA